MTARTDERHYNRTAGSKEFRRSDNLKVHEQLHKSIEKNEKITTD